VLASDAPKTLNNTGSPPSWSIAAATSAVVSSDIDAAVGAADEVVRVLLLVRARIRELRIYNVVGVEVRDIGKSSVERVRRSTRVDLIVREQDGPLVAVVSLEHLEVVVEILGEVTLLYGAGQIKRTGDSGATSESGRGSDGKGTELVGFGAKTGCCNAGSGEGRDGGEDHLHSARL